MNITITNDNIDSWDNYSIEEKRDIAYKLAALSNKLLYSRIRLIEKASDSNSVKNSTKYIGREITYPQRGTTVDIEETLEDYYYVIQTQEDIEYVSICAKLILE